MSGERVATITICGIEDTTTVLEMKRKAAKIKNVEVGKLILLVAGYSLNDDVLYTKRVATRDSLTNFGTFIYIK